MRKISGNGGALYISSEPYDFQNEPLEDCGDGWDWRVRDVTFRHWLEDVEFKFEVYESGRWQPITPVEVHHPSGRVGFGRCLRGLAVRASGRCLPLTHVATSAAWQLEVGFTVHEDSTQGMGDSTSHTLKKGATVAHLLYPQQFDRDAPLQTAIVWLPSGGGGFVGLGAASDTGADEIVVTINEKGVTYVVA